MNKDRKYTKIQPSDYPLLLAKSKYAPKHLYVMGTLPASEIPLVGIAMVGTRRPSNSARELCRRLVFSLKGTNAVIVSGLAQGIDSLCHEAALDAGLPTIAVLAQGFNTNVEGSRGDLLERILEEGSCAVTEFDPETPAYKSNFPSRNRIISGLSSTVVIVQSKTKGGALITADFCRAEKKNLLAVPGDFDNEVASGPNMLLDEAKASPVFIPESLRKLAGIQEPNSVSLRNLAKVGCNLTPEAEALFSKMRGFRKTIGDLERDCHLDASKLLAILTELEIAGLVTTEDNFQFYFEGAL